MSFEGNGRFMAKQVMFTSLRVKQPFVRTYNVDREGDGRHGANLLLSIG